MPALDEIMSHNTKFSSAGLQYFVYFMLNQPPKHAWIVLRTLYALSNVPAKEKGALAALYVDRIVSKNSRNDKVCYAIFECLEARASKEVVDVAIRRAAGLHDWNLMRAWSGWWNAHR